MISPGGIKVVDVTHTYVDQDKNESVLALENVSIDIQAGEFVCIVGASGCGKSTLLYLMAGLLRPTWGSIEIDGHKVTGPGRDRGVVFQDYALLPWKTVRDNVALGPKLNKVPKAARYEIADRFVDMVGLKGFGRKFPHELSGGMRQRAAVARTLAADPDVILMDEPFAAVDAQTRITLQEELVNIWRSAGKTIIFITHSVEEAVFLADRVVVLTSHPGRVREVVPVNIDRALRSPVARSDEQAKLSAHLLGLIRNQPSSAAEANPEAVVPDNTSDSVRDLS